MHRIIIIGPPGAGKTMLSNYLSEKLNIPVFHLDQLFWNSNWNMKHPNEIDEIHDEIFAHERWLIDGYYQDTFYIRIQQSDTVIFLDYSRYRCLFRILCRKLNYRSRPRIDLAEGCEDKFTKNFFDLVWNFKKRQAKKIEEVLAKTKNVSIYRFHNPHETKKFLKKDLLTKVKPEDEISKDRLF